MPSKAAEEIRNFAWKYGVTLEEIADDRNESPATILEWLDNDLTEERDRQISLAIGNVIVKRMEAENRKRRRTRLYEEGSSSPVNIDDLLKMKVGDLISEIIAGLKE